ncbi:hypothetical protein Hsc_3540 [Herbaspirillum seropedicae]|nr:hypothetical protein Hsc_3540 [Herbaspirillum seropedicae]
MGNVRVKNACEMDQLDLNTIWPLSARSRHRTNDAISGLYIVNDLYAGRAKRDPLDCGVRHCNHCTQFSVRMATLVAVVFTMAIVGLWSIFSIWSRNRMNSAHQQWVDQFDGKISGNKNGLLIQKQSQELLIAWNSLAKIELSWSENPWGDPQFGAYCDTDWLLWSDSGVATRISESVTETNSRILLESFERYLPGFKFDYVQFKVTRKDRLFDISGGQLTVWERNPRAPV